MLKGKREVISLEFLKNEYPGETHEEGGVVIDMVCKDQHGAFFIVEMQKSWQQNFKERSLFYASRLITEQAPHGNRRQWVYALKNLKHLKQAPATFTEPKLLQFCQAARYINLTKEEKNMISTKTKNRWDYHNVIDGAKIQGQEIGEALGAHKTAVKVATNLKAMALSTEEIAKATGLSVEEINKL